MSTKSHLLRLIANRWIKIQLGKIKVLGLAIFPCIFLIKDPMVRYHPKKDLPNELKMKKKKTIPHIQNVLTPFLLF